jgi:rod shape-determining protein MreC
VVQQTRAHGIIKGDTEGRCQLNYVSRKEAVNIGDAVVSSGLDGVFAKGLLIGKVTDIVRNKSGIFQDIEVSPFVDFDKIEEVLVVLSPPSQSRYR